MENRTNLGGDPQAEIAVVDDLSAAEQRAAQRWARLRKRVRSITPSGLARFLLVTGAMAAIVALVWFSAGHAGAVCGWAGARVYHRAACELVRSLPTALGVSAAGRSCRTAPDCGRRSSARAAAGSAAPGSDQRPAKRRGSASVSRPARRLSGYAACSGPRARSG